MAYRFDRASGDTKILFSGAPFYGTTFGAATYAIFVRRTALGAYHALLNIGGGPSLSAPEKVTLYATNTDNLIVAKTGFGNSASSQSVNNTATWYLVVVTFPAGAGVARFHVHDGTGWVHSNGTGSLTGDYTVLGTDQIAVARANNVSYDLPGDVVCAGIKRANSSDAQVETLTRTTFQSWLDFGFDWVVGFETITAPVQDQGTPGTGHETARANVSLVADPAGWTWPAPIVTPPPALPVPDGAVLVAFTDPWDEPNPDWTRLDTLTGCRVRGWTVDRGRPNEFAKTGTGTATVRIADLDGLFDPTNATSPYYPNVVPGRQAAINLYNPVSDTWHTRFRGFVEAWRYVLSQTREHMELQLDLVDGFAMLARAELRVGVDGELPLPTEVAEGNVGYAETAGPVGRDRIQAVLGDIGWPYEFRVQPPDPDPDIFTGNVRVGPKVYAAGTSALDALWDAADSEFPGVANLYMDAGGHVTFHGRQARFRPLVAEYGITLYNVGDLATIAGDADAVPVSELEWAIEDSQIYNACIATPEGVGTGPSWRRLDPALDDVAGQLVTDEPSRAAYGLQSLTFDNLQTVEDITTGAGSLAAVKKFATYYVANYKDPHVRISRIVFKSRRPGGDHASPLWQFLNNVEISDLLTVKTAHGGGGGFLREFFVEGLHYTCRPGAPNVPVVELSLDVSPREHWSDGSMFEDDA